MAITKILDESAEKDFNLQRVTKESELYKTKYEDAMQQLNEIKFDTSRVVVKDDFKPLLRSFEQHKAAPDDKNAKMKFLSDLYDMISVVS